MENLSNPGDELQYKPCAEYCPYITGSEEQALTLRGEQYVISPEEQVRTLRGIPYVISSVIDRNLRLAQAKNCIGIEVDEEYPEDLFCNSRSQMFNGKTPGATITVTGQHDAILRRHHSGLWSRTLTETNEYFRGRISELVDKVRNGEYSEDDMVFAQLTPSHLRQFPSRSSHSDLTDEQRTHIFENAAYLDEVDEAVRYNNRYSELEEVGITKDEAMTSMIEEMSDEVERLAQIKFDISLHELSDKPWL